MEDFQHVDFTIEAGNSEAGIIKLLKIIRPTWKKEDCNIEQLIGGSLNKSFKVTVKNNPSVGLVFRVNGPIPDKVGLSRANEVKFLRYFNKHNIGVPLCGTFNNGIVAKLVSGKNADPKTDMVDSKFASLAAKYIARHHHATPKEWPKKATDGSKCSVISLGKISLVRLKEELDEETYKRYAEQLPFETINKELDNMAAELEDLNMPVVLSHNDIWQENLIYDREQGILEFIDYEMCDFNYSPFDIASYMATRSGMPPVPEDKPSKEFIKSFIRIYLEELAFLDQKDRSTVTDKKVETFYVYTVKCMQLFQLFNVPYILYLGDYQKRTGGYIYDFLTCVKILYSEYHNSMEETKNLRLPE